MAKAEQYISEYDAAIAAFNKSVEDYNKGLDAYEATYYQGGVRLMDEEYAGNVGTYFDNGYYYYNVPNFGVTARKPDSIVGGTIIYDEDGGRTVVSNPSTGQTFTIPNNVEGIQVDENTVVDRRGQILQFSANPGNFTQTSPSFDMDRYKSLLTEDFQAEQKTITDAFATEQRALREALAKTQAEEQAKFDAQRAEMERQAAISAAENAKAEEQARASFAQAQADAAAAKTERDIKTKQFKDETEAMQRDVGARRAGYVRARRMRSRSLLSGT